MREIRHAFLSHSSACLPDLPSLILELLVACDISTSCGRVREVSVGSGSGKACSFCPCTVFHQTQWPLLLWVVLSRQLWMGV